MASTVSSKGRALFVLPKDKLGGAERVCATLAQCAARSGDFDGVDLYVLSKPASGSLDEIAATPGLSLIYSGARREASGLAPLARFLRGRRYALAFSTHIHINAYLCLLRRGGVLATDRLVTREAIDAFQHVAGGFSPVFKLGVLAYGNQDLIICQTSRMAESLKQRTRGRLAGKTRVMNNFVDLERIGRQRAEATALLDHIPAHATRIAWCGRMDPQKRPERAVQVIAELRQGAMPDAHLVMIGDGQLRPLVEQEIARLGVRDGVTLCGYQKNPVALMARCDLGLLTSDLEGFPNVVLEMLAAGVRGVVTTDCAGDLAGLPHVLVSGDMAPAQLASPVAAAASEFLTPVKPELLAERSILTYYRTMWVA